MDCLRLTGVHKKKKKTLNSCLQKARAAADEVYPKRVTPYLGRMGSVDLLVIICAERKFFAFLIFRALTDADLEHMGVRLMPGYKDPYYKR